uniref:Uncharacterized protein n=1 Tax=Arundo donax TaxID=35708 RepID=A0A0A8ZC55_ARUDO
MCHPAIVNSCSLQVV